MLKTTYKLVEYLKLTEQEREVSIICSLVNSIIKCGNKSDADIILNQYLTNFDEFHYSYLLPILKKWGDFSTAEQIFNVSIYQNLLIKNVNSEILEVLGHLKYPPIKPILINYIFEEKDIDYDTSKNAVLGLLNFDCSEYQYTIQLAIEQCYRENLFPEFIPALVCKLEDRNSSLEKLYELGDKFASTDCNAGILLGFSLCGQQGKEYFKKALFDENWEASSFGTGTIHFAYEGIKNLGITFKELFHEIKSTSDKKKLEYHIDVFFALLRKKIDDIEDFQEELFADIYTILFKWKHDNERDNIIDLARSLDKTEEAYEIKKLLELKMNEEAILLNYIS